MAGSGFFLGGMAEGIESANKQALAEDKFAFDQGIQNRTLALAEQQARNEQRRVQVAQGDKLIGDYMTVIKEIATNGRNSGKIDDARKLITPLLTEVQSLATINGRNPSLYTNQVQAILSGPTPEEAARAAGAAEASKKTSEAKGLMDMGVSREAALESVGIKQPSGIPLKTFKVGDTFETVRGDDPEAIQNVIGRGGVEANPITPSDSGKTDIKLRTFKVGNKFVSVRSDNAAGIDKLLAEGAVESTPVSSNKDENSALKTFMVKGKPVTVRADDQAAIDKVIADGGVETRISVQASNLDDAGGTTSVDPKTVREARVRVRDTTSTLAKVDDAAKAFKKNPEAGGVSGFLIDKVGGLVEQLPGGIGEELTSAAGIDTAAVQEARTKARTVLGNLISTITGDTSGRYSDRDVKAAEQAIPATKETSSPKQIQAAYAAIHESLVETRLDAVEDLRSAANISDDDLGTEEGVEKLGSILTKHRMGPEEAAKVIGQVRKRLGIKELKGKAASQEQLSENGQPPVAGAQKAADGNWYVENPPRSGKWFRVKKRAR
jgi:hypothetical protein